MTSAAQPHRPDTDRQDDSIHCVLGDDSVLAQSLDKQPIGVFDSGVGGLSVLQHLQAEMPDEQFVYLADTKHVPYGERTPAEIEQLTHAAVDWLYRQRCKLVVVACNSASTHSLPSLREKYGDTLPIVGLVPALKPAVKHTKTKTVAVLATKATLNGYLLNQVIDEIAQPAGVEVLKFAEPSLVPWVESGMSETDAAFDTLRSIIETAQTHEADHFVLGCTHYPFFKAKIALIAPDLTIIDSGAAIARRVKSVLNSGDTLEYKYKKTTQQKIKPVIFTTGNMSADKTKIKKLLG